MVRQRYKLWFSPFSLPSILYGTRCFRLATDLTLKEATTNIHVGGRHRADIQNLVKGQAGSHNTVFSSMIPNVRHNAAALLQVSMAVVDWLHLLFDTSCHTCSATPPVFGFQASLPTDEGVGLLHNVQRFWLL